MKSTTAVKEKDIKDAIASGTTGLDEKLASIQTDLGITI